LIKCHLGVQTLQHGKIIIVSRRFPSISDDPELRSFQDRLQLVGLKYEETQELLASNSVVLPPSLLRKVWLKTGQGIPQALRALMERLRNAQDPEKLVDEIPPGQKEWMDTQVHDLSSRTREFMIVLSILRRPETRLCCYRMWKEGEDFDRRLKALQARCLLDSMDDTDSILILNPFREYILAEKVSPQKRIELRDHASNVYWMMASEVQSQDRVSLLIEAIWHAQQARRWERVLEAAFELRREQPHLEKNPAVLGQIDHLVVQAARQTNNKQVLVDWLVLHGKRLSLTEELPRAVSMLEEAYETARQYSDESTQFQSARSLAEMYYAQGRYDQALEKYDTCFDLAQSIDNSDWLLEVLIEFGNTQLRTHQISQAEETLKRCVAQAQKRGATTAEAKALCKLARLYLKHKKEDVNVQRDAIRFLEKARILFTEADNQDGLAETYGLMGDFHRYEKNREKARECYAQSREIECQQGHRAQEAITIGQMAFLARDQGQYDEALHLCEEAMQLSRRLGNVVGEQIDMVLRGEILIALRRLDEAYRQIVDARKLAADPRQLQVIGIASADRALSQHYYAVGHYDAARESIDRALGEYIGIKSFQYARETWERAKPIYREWAAHSDVETVHKEFSRIAYDNTEVYRLERVLLLAKLLLTEAHLLAGLENPSGPLSDLCDTLYLLEEIASHRWLPEIVKFCVENWATLAPDIFQKVISWIEADQREGVYRYWIAAAIRDGNFESFAAIFKEVEAETLAFKSKFILLEPIEPEVINDKEMSQSLAKIYVNGLLQEINQSIRTLRPMPLYVHSVYRALDYLDRDQFEFIQKYAADKLANARQDLLVGEDFDFLSEEIPLNLKNKQVTIIGGSANVRRHVAQEALRQFGLRDLREVPPSWEKHVNTNKVQAAVQGADLIVKVWKHMGHDLDDCLKAVLTDVSLNDRIRYAQGDGQSSIVRAIRDYFVQN